MPKGLRATIVYEMHIFKDVDNTSWTNPQTHTFQLAEGAATPFLDGRGSQSGIMNLRRCSPAQLSFLQSHLAAQNLALKNARDLEKKAQKAKELRQKQEAQEEQERRAEEVRKWQLGMEERASKLRGERKGDEKKEDENSTPEDSEEQSGNRSSETIPIPCSPYRAPGSYPLPHRYRENVVPIYPHPGSPPIYNITPPLPSCYSPPPPPPPLVYDRTPRRYLATRRGRYEDSNPLQKESDWRLESVELDLVPIVSKLKVKKPKTKPLGPGQRLRDNHNDYPRTRGFRGKLPVLSYQLADSANTEFAVVYSRTVMTTVPYVDYDRRSGRVYCPSVDESIYEYDSDEGIDDIVTNDDNEGDEQKGTEDKDEEEDDLEIVEGFKHCHPITESMSKCCLEK